MVEATVSAGYAKELMDFAVSKGAPQRQLAEMSQIRLEDLQDPDNRLSLASYVALMKASIQLCNDSSLPLHLGAATNFNKISVVGMLCNSAPTMGEALMQLNRYGYLVAELDVPCTNERFQLNRRDGELWLEDTRNDPNSFPELTEETWSRFICESARAFPDLPFAKAVHVTHPEPEHSAEYDRVLKVPVFFNSDKNALLIEESCLSIKLHEPNSYIFGILSEHAEKLLKSLDNAKTVRGRVEGLLIPNLHKGDLGMEPIAAKMGLSGQTLYRRLKVEGVSYEKLLDELRLKMALDYLSSKKVSVNETAYLVGFSHPSAFSRAFKRWTGSRPRKTRSLKIGRSN